MATVGEMYGLVWTPNTQRQIPVALTPDPDTKGCYVYRAKPGDSIGMLADTWGVEPAELLYNNTEIISDLEKPIDGKLLSVCGLGEWRYLSDCFLIEHARPVMSLLSDVHASSPWKSRLSQN